jgi:hypothetical protein
MSRAVLLAMMLSLAFFGFFQGTHAQDSTDNSQHIVTRPGSVLLELRNGAVDPVWCDAETVAMARWSDDGQRRWIEIHRLGSATVRTESLLEGALVACSRGGTEWVELRGGTDTGIGQYLLVRASDRHEVELAAWGLFISADHSLRSFVFETDIQMGGAPTFELVTVENARQGHFWQTRATTIVASQYAAVQTVAISGDGRNLAYATRQKHHSGARREGLPLELVLSRTGESQTRRLRMADLIDEETQLDSLFFAGDRLVIAGISTAGKLIVAICPADAARATACQEQSTGLDGRAFEVASLGSNGLPIIAARFSGIGELGRPCLFELSKANRDAAPSACRLTVPPKPTYGSEPEPFYSMAPDRRHVTVLTQGRWPRDTWVVVSLSEFQNQ